MEVLTSAAAFLQCLGPSRTLYCWHQQNCLSASTQAQMGTRCRWYSLGYVKCKLWVFDSFDSGEDRIPQSSHKMPHTLSGTCVDRWMVCCWMAGRGQEANQP